MIIKNYDAQKPASFTGLWKAFESIFGLFARLIKKITLNHLKFLDQCCPTENNISHICNLEF